MDSIYFRRDCLFSDEKKLTLQLTPNSSCLWMHEMKCISITLNVSGGLKKFPFWVFILFHIAILKTTNGHQAWTTSLRSRGVFDQKSLKFYWMIILRNFSVFWILLIIFCKLLVVSSWYFQVCWKTIKWCCEFQNWWKWWLNCYSIYAVAK